jgi:hypothetical protein
MKRLDGEFTNQLGIDELQTWNDIAKSNDEKYRLQLTNETFRRKGSIEFDETTPHGITFFNYLSLNGWIENPRDHYLSDGSDRPEFISQATKDAQKAEQDSIDNTVNRPRIISALDSMEYHERTKAQYDGFSYDILTAYFTLMVSKQNHIKEILELKFLEGTKAEWDIEGAKTDADLLIEIGTLKADETRKRPDPPPIDHTQDIIDLKASLTQISYPDKIQTEIDAMSYEELAQYHSQSVHKQNLIVQIIELKYDYQIQIDEIKSIQEQIKRREDHIINIDLAIIDLPDDQKLKDDKTLIEAEIQALQSDLSTKSTAVRSTMQIDRDTEGAKTYDALVSEIRTILSAGD